MIVRPNLDVFVIIFVCYPNSLAHTIMHYFAKIELSVAGGVVFFVSFFLLSVETKL